MKAAAAATTMTAMHDDARRRPARLPLPAPRGRACPDEYLV